MVKHYFIRSNTAVHEDILNFFCHSACKMVELKPSAQDTVQPKPKYGHLTDIDPEFAPLKAPTDEAFAQLWSLPMAEFKMGWLTTPPALPENCPVPGKDIEISDIQVPVRDGTKLGVRIYKSVKPQKDAVLVLKAHGGGMLDCSTKTHSSAT
jgi:acetyl esterase/lipase